MSYLLDTMVLCEPTTKKPNRRVIDWLDQQTESSLYLSVVTLGEIAKGVSRLPSSDRRTTLHSWLRDDLPRRFVGRVLPIDAAVAMLWGNMLARAELDGKPVPAVDALIAATAAEHGLTVATRNTQHMDRCGVPVIDPWHE